MTPSTYKLRLPQGRTVDHYAASVKTLEQLAFWQTKRIHFFQF